MINPISAADAAQALSPMSAPAAAAPAGDFSQWLTQKMDETNTQLLQADTQVRQLAVGETTNLHQVMMSLEKARLSLELVVQVRNKVLDAYQNMMQMQV
jgi:flagellar hook-basal body complex protein FliE